MNVLGYTPPDPTGTPMPVPMCVPGDRLVQTADAVLCVPGLAQSGSSVDVAALFVVTLALLVTGAVLAALGWAGLTLTVRLMAAWMAFSAGTVFVVYAIVRVHFDGWTLIGLGLLGFWFWGIGGFRRSFWIDDDPRLAEIDHELEEQGR